MHRNLELTAEDGHRLLACVAEPDVPSRAGLIVLHEIFGLNAHIRSVTERFAQSGFLAVAPALFDRIRPGVDLGYDTLTEGRALVAQLDPANTLRDIAACVPEAAKAGKVFVVGYCWGAALAYRAACALPVAAGVCYYGRLIVEMLDQRPRCPVMYHYGADDPLIPAENVQRVRAACPEGILHLYEGAGHGFSCDARADFRPAAAALALRRTLSFFDAVL